ncbi:Uncharacterised protein [Zhongshania aliphaticivorans]|uniref:GPI inositol-deacylase PGAP1-like alpha/beta domain-containing protein n=1 Tax=Zhongshania aliphaticivorans TaxID=1470434 RepID=A0A5S9Q0M7_9GAMM|nr:hypothetical protein [Zhongshania aliphaticivorans]CAA0092807.1 Uncharacterised protein [Zhongshania aliphaticivorans]CAA0110303.1 Uncharacterised protein [Zhongshania aliphaticivorans]
MTHPLVKHASDILGAGRLAVDAVAGVSEISEGLHHAIINLGGVLTSSPQQYSLQDSAQAIIKGQNPKPLPRTQGITGLVYDSVRGVNGLVGLGLDALIRQLTRSVDERPESLARNALVSALNGVLGDHLQTKQNPLAITMSFRSEGRSLSEDELAGFMAKANDRVAVFVHGLCMNDEQWLRRGHDHGQALARDLGLTPLYLKYNTGLHISENGRQLAALLQGLVSHSSESTELYIIAHSMGGLVSRSACHYAMNNACDWPSRLQKMICLGTPHHGAMLERGGNWLDLILDSNPYSSPFARLARLRSSGITDLRYGNIVDEDWNNVDRFAMVGDQRHMQRLPIDVLNYAIAASTVGREENIGDSFLGDGLVAVDSALGHHVDPRFNLDYPAGNCWVGRGINHMDLLNDAEVYRVLLAFMRHREGEE